MANKTKPRDLVGRSITVNALAWIDKEWHGKTGVIYYDLKGTIKIYSPADRNLKLTLHKNREGVVDEYTLIPGYRKSVIESRVAFSDYPLFKELRISNSLVATAFKYNSPVAFATTSNAKRQQILDGVTAILEHLIKTNKIIKK